MDIFNDSSQASDITSTAGLRLITRPRLRELLQISPRIFQQLEANSLPAPIMINSKRCWLEQDIRLWLESQRVGCGHDA